MKTLIHHSGALGDTLLSFPCFHAIKADSETLHFAGRTDIAALLNETGIADASDASDRAVWTPLYASGISAALEYLKQFERAFVFTADPDSAIVENIRASIPRTHTVRTIPPIGSSIPIALFRLLQVCPNPLPAFVSPRLHIPRMHQEYARSSLQSAATNTASQLIAIHPGSGGKSKCWPLERFFELVDTVQSVFSPTVVFFSGPAEDDVFKKRISRFASSRDNILHIQDTKLIHASAILCLCTLFIGNDSGFSHLASAVHCPTITLFGPTDPKLWKMTDGDREIVLSSFPGSIDEIQVVQVYEQASYAFRREAARYGLA